MKVALTGASGFVGSALSKNFKDFVIISRNDDENKILQKLEGVDVVINLAGAPIVKRWDAAYKKVLLDSRIETTRKLVSAINKSEVQHFISSSAIGIYPDNLKCDESTVEIAEDFLGELAYKWEKEALLCRKPMTILRFSMVLGKGGGAFDKMLIPFKLGLGGVISDGKMMMSWISLNDLVRLHQFVIEQKITGIINAVAPKPVTNYIFTKALGKALRRPTVLPLPAFVLRLLYGEAATVLTGSKEVYSSILKEKGFVFDHADIDACLRHLTK